MIKLLIGLILILIPFLLVNLFQDKKKGFFYVLAGLIGFHLIIAILTQALHIFSYGVIIFINILLCIFSLFIFFKKSNINNLFKNIKAIRINWMLVFILIVLIIELGSVHLNYSGKVTTAIDQYKEVKNIRIDYPYYSDEWSVVSLIQYSINTRSLPLKNPLTLNNDFNNFEICFDSFISELVLLFGLIPLTQYYFLTLFFGILVCLLIYFLLRVNNVGNFYAGVASLFIPFIVNSANLPGIWYLIPLILGIVCMLIGYIFLSMNDKKAGLIMSLLVLGFYPPLFVFYSISILFYFIFSDLSKKTKITYLGLYFGLVFVSALILSAFAFIVKDYSLVNTFNSIISKLFYPTFTDNAIPDYSIWKIIPIPIILLGFLGIYLNLNNRRKYWLVLPILIGLIYWFIYSFVLWRFIIEYQRVVLVSSILIVGFSGFGLEFLFNKFKKITYFNNMYFILIIQTLLLIFLLLFSFYYTSNDNWMELKLNYVNSNKIIAPNSPASNYLVSEDLFLFRDIHGKRFLSIPWKGLVLGVATDNYPLSTKASTLGVNILTYFDFMTSDCNKKRELALKYKLDYVYSEKFDCPDFKFISKSREGLNLYEFVKN